MAGDTSERPAGPELDAVQASAVAPRSVRWLWPGRIPQGELSILAGVQGRGKSTVTADLIGRFTRADAWPGGRTVHGDPGTVVLIAHEDDLETVVVPRLMAAQAVLDRVHLVRGLKDGRADWSSWVDALDLKLNTLPRPLLVILDPVSSMFSGKRNSEDDVRPALQRIVQSCRTTGATIIGVCHERKGETAEALFRVSGSIAWTSIARAVHLVVSDPRDPDQRLLVPLKVSAARKPAALRFTLQAREVSDPAGAAITTSGIEWDGRPVEAADVAAALSPQQGRPGPKPIQGDGCRSWLRQALGDGAKHAADEIKSEAATRGYSSSTLRRAVEGIGVVKVRGKWHLPAPNDDAAA